MQGESVPVRFLEPEASRQAESVSQKNVIDMVIYQINSLISLFQI